MRLLLILLLSVLLGGCGYNTIQQKDEAVDAAWSQVLNVYKRRADEGSDDAQYQLGVRYLTGKGTAKNEKLGREWLGKAAKQGHSQASKKLAELGPEVQKSAAAPAAAPVPVKVEKK